MTKLLAAVEGPRRGHHHGFRATVLADVDLFVDVIVPRSDGEPQTIIVSSSLLGDSIRWLAREER